MVPYTDAVIEPWTVMVKALDTSITNGAVARPWSAQDETVRAHFTRMYLRE